MIIGMDRPFANDPLDGPAFCKWLSGWAGLWQIIIWISQPFANDHLSWPVFCKWSSGWAGLLQTTIWIGRPFANDHPDFFFSTRFPLLLQIWGSRFNIADLSRTICFCWISNGMCIWSTKSSRRRQMPHSKFTSMPIHMIWLIAFWASGVKEGD